jgi:hypothetical protein
MVAMDDGVERGDRHGRSLRRTAYPAITPMS